MARKRATEQESGMPRPVRQAAHWYEESRTLVSASTMQPLVTNPICAPPSPPIQAMPAQPMYVEAFHIPPRTTPVTPRNRYDGWDDTVFAATRQIIARLRFLLMHTLTNQQKNRIAFSSIFDEFETLFTNDTRRFYWEVKHNTFCFTLQRANESMKKEKDEWKKIHLAQHAELEVLRQELKQVDEEREYNELLHAVAEIMDESPQTTHSSLATEEELSPSVEAQPVLDGQFFGIHGQDVMLDNIDEWLDTLIETNVACYV